MQKYLISSRIQKQRKQRLTELNKIQQMKPYC